EREMRRSEPQNPGANQVLEYPLRVSNLVAKLLRAELRHTTMAVSVGGDLVSLSRDATNHVGMTLGDPAEREEGARRPRVREHREQLVHARFHSALQAVPLEQRDPPFEAEEV